MTDAQKAPMKKTIRVTIEKVIEIELTPSVFGQMTEAEYIAEFKNETGAGLDADADIKPIETARVDGVRCHGDACAAGQKPCPTPKACGVQGGGHADQV
jgi:hypothetical protein